MNGFNMLSFYFIIIAAYKRGKHMHYIHTYNSILSKISHRRGVGFCYCALAIDAQTETHTLTHTRSIILLWGCRDENPHMRTHVTYVPHVQRASAGEQQPDPPVRRADNIHFVFGILITDWDNKN